jgi:hypothetical protein
MRTSHRFTLSLGLLLAASACEGKIIGPPGGNGDGGGGVDAPEAIDAPGPPPIPADCLEAANRGLAWLVTKQGADGSWGTGSKLATTGFAVLKLETYAAEIGKSPFDPTFIYAQEVAKGLDFLFSRAQVAPITPQPAGDPDTNGNGKGVLFTGLMYENAIGLMAIAAGAEPDRVVTTAGSAVVGQTYRAVVQDVVDYFAFAQGDSPTSSAASCTRGGWRYSAFDRNPAVGDNSVTQFATLALEYARHPQYHYTATIPDWMMVELRDWVTCIQNHDGGANDGASGYTNAREILNAYKTGALVQQAAFLGDTTNSANVVAAVGYLGRVWNDTTGVGWKLAPVSDYLAMYSVMKGMESLAITDINGIGWYREFCDQLKAEQQADGSWPASRYERDPLGASGLNSTEWALLVLERAAPPPEIITRQF